MTDEYKAVMEDLTNGRVAFEDRTHGTDQGLLEAMASSTYKSFKVIPGHLLTDSLIELGSKSLCEMMGEEDCFVSGDYEATALALMNRKVGLLILHQDLLTRPIIEACLNISLYDTIERRDRIGVNGRSLITDEDLNKAIESRIDLLGLLDPDEVRLITDEALTRAITNNPSQGMLLEKVGRRDILIKAVAGGLWHNDMTWGEPSDNLTGRPRPPTLRDSITARMKIDDRAAYDILYYDCYAAGFPVEDFKHLVRSKARQDWIVGIFSADELIKVFKDDLGMKGRILEYDLGM